MLRKRSAVLSTLALLLAFGWAAPASETTTSPPCSVGDTERVGFVAVDGFSDGSLAVDGWWIGLTWQDDGTNVVYHLEPSRIEGVPILLYEFPEHGDTGVRRGFVELFDASSYVGVQIELRSELPHSAVVVIESFDPAIGGQYSFKNSVSECHIDLSSEWIVVRIPFGQFSLEEYVREDYPDATPGVNVQEIHEIHVRPLQSEGVIEILRLGFYRN